MTDSFALYLDLTMRGNQESLRIAASELVEVRRRQRAAIDAMGTVYEELVRLYPENRKAIERSLAPLCSALAVWPFAPPPTPPEGSPGPEIVN